MSVRSLDIESVNDCVIDDASNFCVADSVHLYHGGATSLDDLILAQIVGEDRDNLIAYDKYMNTLNL